MPYSMPRIRRRVTTAVEEARRYVPGYGTGRPASSRELDRLLAAGGLKVLRADLRDVPVDVWPRTHGVIRIFVDHSVGPAVLRYVKLHEAGHWLAGDAEEPIAFAFDGPLPEAEPVADLFALLGLLDRAEIEQGPEYVDGRLRELVPLDDRGWQVHRIPWLARELVYLVARSP